ncbi:MAG: methylase, partial [Veillonellaceae bacterium]|nr:methylase [Veillonellaceae bacterium]
MDRQAKAAADFAAKWASVGDEKQDSQRFWIELLQKVYGIDDPASFVRFEQRVKLSHVSYIDVVIPATHTIIEQKSLGKALDAPIKQSDGTFLKPFEQAQRYASHLPYSERPRWIVSCNFSDFLVYDMEHPNAEPQHIALADLGKEYYRLAFLVDVADSHVQKELDLSRAAGTLVGKIYNALLPAYGAQPTAKDLQDLNKFIVRLVFCFYAEDADLFGKKDMFHDYLASFMPEHFRTGLMELFKVLDQKPEERDRFLEDRLKAFPYVNGSLFTETIPVPPINEATRRLILEDGCGFDWSQISPTIFGAIFESSLNPETRRRGGMHYTSIENIHKVIDPLFLDDYKAQYEAAMQETNDKKRIQKLKEL